MSRIACLMFLAVFGHVTAVTELRTRVKLHEQDAASTAMESTKGAVARLEQQFAMVQEAVRSGKVTPGVKEVIESMESLIAKEIEPPIRKAHSDDQKDVGEALDALSSCEAARARADEVSGQLKTESERRWKLHEVCRAEEASLKVATLWTRWAVCRVPAYHAARVTMCERAVCCHSGRV